MADFKTHPLHDSALQRGFSPEKGGNLRDHNGCKAGIGVVATAHYDGDFGVKDVLAGLAASLAKKPAAPASPSEMGRLTPGPAPKKPTKPAKPSSPMYNIIGNRG